MASASDSNPPVKRIAIAIELDYAYPWHHGCYHGILQYAQQREGWLCIVDPFLIGLDEQGEGKGYDGVVGRIDQASADLAASHGIPAVSHWGNSPAQDLPSVLVDDVAVGRLTGEHLIACGYRRFAFAGITNNRPGDRQLDGLTQTVTSKGFSAPDLWLYAYDFEEDRDKLARFRTELIDWLRGMELPVGLAAINATAARYIAQVCYELGLDVPRDVGIVVQTSDVSSDTGSPSITSVQCDYEQVGYDAAQMLDELMQGMEVHPQHRVHAPTRLIPRDSTDVFLCDDPLVKDAMRFIAEHCRQTLKVEEVAEALLVSESTLRRRFEQALGRAVKDEIARLRTDYVKTLLVETDTPLAALANECGYSSPTQFSRYFNNAVGMTPSAYRKQHRDEAGA